MSVVIYAGRGTRAGCSNLVLDPGTQSAESPPILSYPLEQIVLGYSLGGWVVFCWCGQSLLLIYIYFSSCLVVFISHDPTAYFSIIISL